GAWGGDANSAAVAQMLTNGRKLNIPVLAAGGLLAVVARGPQRRPEASHGAAQAGGELLPGRLERPTHRHGRGRRLVDARWVLEGVAEQDAQALALAQGAGGRVGTGQLDDGPLTGQQPFAAGGDLHRGHAARESLTIVRVEVEAVDRPALRRQRSLVV